MRLEISALKRPLAGVIAAAALMTVVPGESQASLIFYGDRPSFNAAAPGLPVQSFNGANLFNQVYVFEPNGLSSTTSDPVFSAGRILPGLTLTDPQPGSQSQALIVYGGGPVGSISVGDAWFDELDLSFGPGVSAVGEDVFANTAASASFAGNITEAVFSGATQLGQKTLTEALGGSVFFGYVSTTLPITKVELTWGGDGDGVTFVSNVAFGTPTAAPEPSNFVLTATALTAAVLCISAAVNWHRNKKRASNSSLS
jgi:hypothetical protein